MNSSDIAPVLVSVIFFMIPIVAILTSHQRKMAEIIHGRHEALANKDQTVQALTDSVNRLNAEVVELKQLVAQQIIASDQTPVPAGEYLSRIGAK